MSNITINSKENAIELTKAFEKKASQYGTPEYNELQAVRRDYPTYNVVVKRPAKRIGCFKGLDRDYMESYIERKIEKAEDSEAKTKYIEVLQKFYSLCGKDENGEDVDFAEIATYGELKKWFLYNFPELHIQRKTIDEILSECKKVA